MIYLMIYTYIVKVKIIWFMKEREWRLFWNGVTSYIALARMHGVCGATVVGIEWSLISFIYTTCRRLPISVLFSLIITWQCLYSSILGLGWIGTHVSADPVAAARRNKSSSRKPQAASRKWFRSKWTTYCLYVPLAHWMSLCLCLFIHLATLFKPVLVEV